MDDKTKYGLQIFEGFTQKDTKLSKAEFISVRVTFDTLEEAFEYAVQSGWATGLLPKYGKVWPLVGKGSFGGSIGTTDAVYAIPRWHE